MLVMPYSHDQPDNARRVRRLGVARVLDRRQYTPARAASRLSALLGEARYRERAQAIRQRILEEDGLNAACNALERLAAGAQARD
jgi:UDP:flavonoid glycosyltransferase YjiC (YdhE family)